MTQFSNKALYFGLGLVNLTREKAEAVVEDLIRRGEVEREESKRWVDDLVEKGQQQRDEVTNFLEQEMERLMQKLRVPARSDLANLENRVQKLEERVNRLENRLEPE